MSSSVTTPLLKDAVDSYYQYVQARTVAKMAVIAPTVQTIENGVGVSFKCGGISQARDWPMPDMNMNCPYLLLQTDEPIPFGRSVSQYSPQIRHKLVWAWAVSGDNIGQTEVAANRGNKYGINMAIVQALIHGNYPGFTDKVQWSVQADGNGNPQAVSTPYDPIEKIRWGMPKFVDKIDRDSGILFCSGNVVLVHFAPEITL